MHIVFICDANYVMPTSVTISSLVASHPASEKLDIAIVGVGLDDSARTPLATWARENVSVEFVDGTETLRRDGIDLADSTYRTATKAALLKFHLPDLLPRWDKALYLDGDLLIRRSLATLYSTELGDNYAAVVRDLPQVLYDKPLLGNDRNYFNSGVMLLNLGLMRTEGLPKKLVALKKGLDSDNLVDQNVFNIAFADRTVQLSPEYNLCCMNLQRRWRREHVLKRINDLYGTEYRSFRDLVSRSAIIHYSSKEKPWAYRDVLFVREWDCARHKTDYGNIPLKRRSYRAQRFLLLLKRLFLWENRPD